MTLTEFNSSLSKPDPPKNIDPLLAALWYDAKGDWKKAHELAQNVHSKNGSWIHGYLHRKEGDKSNATYWYQRIGKKLSATSLEEEWEIIVKTLLKEVQ